MIVPLGLLLFMWTWTPASDVGGTVIDPQALPVAEARVELVCDGKATSTTTSDSGQFNFVAVPTQVPCTVVVTREGFAPVTLNIGPGDSDAVVVRLRLAGVTELVNVVETNAEPEPEIRAAIGSIWLEGEQLSRIFSRTEDMIRHAVLMSGSGTNGTSVYIDGLPATVMPPAEMVGQIGVNAGPFSAEYGDGDVTRIQIITRAAARRFRVSPSGSLLGFGGGEGLRDGLRSKSSSGSVSISGPIPRLPVTFAGSLQSSRHENELALQAVVPTDLALDAFPASAGVTYAGRTRSATLNAFYSPSAAIRAHVGYSATRSTASNVGVGGLILPSAGFATGSATDSVHANVSTARRELLFEGGFVARSTSSSLRANSHAQGISVAGHFVAGGASIAAQDSDRLTWMAKQVTRSSSFHPWAVGVTVGGASQTHLQIPNSLGSVEFESAEAFAAALNGAATATWLVARGDGSTVYRGLTAAPFAQKMLVRKNRIQLDGGLRADYQSRIGTVLSPRIWAAGDWRGVALQAGSGLFVNFVPDHVFVKALTSEDHHLRQFMTTGASLATLAEDLTSQVVVGTTLHPRLRAARQFMQRVAVARPVGGFTPSVEYTWTRDGHRLGSDRVAAGSEWVDVIESNRSASRHRLKTRVQYVRKGQSLAAHYEWLRAFDNGDGPFSYPERQGQFGSEWARSAGFAPHNVTVAAVVTLPFRIYAAVTDTWQDSVPYNITAGVDTDRNGVFNERGGWLRNSGNGPSQHLLSVHMSRRFELPKIDSWFQERFRINVGAHLDNISNNRNYTTMGSVAGSATFGRPLSANSGRSARFFLSLE